MKSITVAILSLLALPAMAETNSVSQSGSWSSSGVNIGSAVQAPSAIAPGLIAGGLSCSGSASLGGSASGWGIALGITRKDEACNAREDAKYIHGVTGSVSAAKERLCAVKEIREAFLRAGEPCAVDISRSDARGGRTFASLEECREWVRATGAKAVCRFR